MCILSTRSETSGDGYHVKVIEFVILDDARVDLAQELGPGVTGSANRRIGVHPSLQKESYINIILNRFD